MTTQSKILFFALLIFSFATHNTTVCMMNKLISKAMECFLGFNNETGIKNSISEEGTEATLNAVTEVEKAKEKKEKEATKIESIFDYATK